MKTILLTGGSGFIGRNIKESFLAGKFNIVAPGSKELNLADSDSVDRFFKNNTIDVVIHSACKPGHRNAKDFSEILKINTVMFFNLEKHCKRYEKMIFMGSGSGYDMRFYKPKMKEEFFGTHVPVDDTGLAKYICGKTISRSDNIYDLRIFGIFGKYEDYAIRFISNLVCKAIFNLPLTMNQNRRFDFLFIDDLMPVLYYFITNTPRYSNYNVTPDNTVELCAVAEKIKALSGKDLPIVISKEGMGVEYSGDNSRLKNEVPDLCFTTIDESIEKLYFWYKENCSIINKELLLVDK